MRLRNPMYVGPPRERRRPLRAVLLLALAALAAAGWLRGSAPSSLPTLRSLLARFLPLAPDSPPRGDAAAAPAPPPGRGEPSSLPATAAPPPPEATRPLASADQLARSGLEQLRIRIDGPLEPALERSLGKPLGPQLAQVITRSLVWWVSVPSDLRRGDRLEVLFQRRGGEEPALHAIRFRSGKLDRLFRAYRFQPPGDAHPRLFQPSGEELELRLRDAPLDDYEQVTSLIRDGRRHQGVDFKTPAGTPVKATFSGVITRKNWKWRANGNCLEVSEASGARRALYLHLDELPRTLRVGQPVALGEVVARSGNSGHSFAPHLHYQLMRGESEVLDPFQEEHTFRRPVPPELRAALDGEVIRLDGLLDAVAASN